MATYYWVGGNGSWNGSSTTNWSNASGGAGGFGPPTSNDDVIFNSASSGASYIVDCNAPFAGVGACKSITTAAPAVGTLTFRCNDTFSGNFFQVINGNINIHAACLFTVASSSYGSRGLITHSGPGTGASITTTFNGSGSNTAPIIYQFYGNTNDSINFCSSQTCSFSQVTLNMQGGNVTCTGSTITLSTAYGNTSFSSSGAGTTTLTTTTFNNSSSFSYTFSFDISSTSYSTATTNITVNSIASATINIGSASSVPASFGNISITDSTGASNIYANNFTNLSLVSSVAFQGVTTLYRKNTGASATISGTTTLTGCTLTIANGYTFTGNVTTSKVGAVFPSISFSLPETIVFSGAITATDLNITGQISNNVTFNGAVTFSGTAAQPSGLGIYFTTNFGGTVIFTAGLTITPFAATASRGVLIGNYFTADAMTLTNTTIDSYAVTLNGGVGKAFSYTVNANAPTAAAGTPIYIRGGLTSTVPTFSITGTTTKRANVGLPSLTTPNQTSLIISGATPTFTNVNFIRASINNGTSNYTGTLLGTDGTSNGFVATVPTNKYLVAGTGSVAYDGAIWALTSGGATSANNFPLPQDTVIIDSNSTPTGSVDLTYGDSAYMNNLSNEGTPQQVSMNNIYEVALFGNFSHTNTRTLNFGNLSLYQSGNTDRVFQYNSGTQFNSVSTYTFNIGVGGSNVITISRTTSLTTLSGYYNLNLASGIITILNTAFGGDNYSSAVSLTIGTSLPVTINGGNFQFVCKDCTIGANATINTTNYIVNMRFTGGTYTNSATTTAQNGAIYFGGFGAGPYSNTIASSSSTATNPFVDLRQLFSSFTTPSDSIINITGAVYTQNFSQSTSNKWQLKSASGVSSVVKTNGGRAGVFADVTNITASPANTWYTSGTLTGTTTGWIIGSPDSESSSGFFIF